MKVDRVSASYQMPDIDRAHAAELTRWRADIAPSRQLPPRPGRILGYTLSGVAGACSVALLYAIVLRVLP